MLVFKKTAFSNEHNLKGSDWSGFCNYYQQLFLQHCFCDHGNLYISFCSFYFSFVITLVLLIIMRSQPALAAWTVTSTAAFYHCWSKRNILCCTCCSYELYAFIWFWFSKCQRYVTLHMVKFASSTVDYENWYCFISIEFDVEKSE